ncbi:MAG: hypothetical protein J2P36_21565, partial [Ktedonobacteraceae bacterium]|nr:hypothetical protein [Ktedonobacteraceae bacterium]
KKAVDKQQESSSHILFLLRLDNVLVKNTSRWASQLRQTRHIRNFTHWKQDDIYQRELEQLLGDLTSNPIQQPENKRVPSRIPYTSQTPANSSTVSL